MTGTLQDAAYWLGRPMTRQDAELAGMDLHFAAMELLGEQWD